MKIMPTSGVSKKLEFSLIHVSRLCVFHSTKADGFRSHQVFKGQRDFHPFYFSRDLVFCDVINRVFPKVDHSARIVLGQLLN